MSLIKGDHFNILIKHLNHCFNESQMKTSEYHDMIEWLNRLGQNGKISLLFTYCIEQSIYNHFQSCSNNTIQYPLDLHYIEGAPVLDLPYKLPMRDDEKGDKLIFSGKVIDQNGNPITKALVDMWQADAKGYYSGFDSDAPPYNLRGRFYTDSNGQFEVETIVPSNLFSCEIALFEFVENFSSIKFKIKRRGYETLLTQVFLEEKSNMKSAHITQIIDYGDFYKATKEFVLNVN